MNCGNLWFTTKFGGTPKLTRETRVLPTKRAEQRAHFLVHVR